MSKLIRIAMTSAQPLLLLVEHPQPAQSGSSSSKAANKRASSITGRVTTDSGEPIPNAIIRTNQLGKSQNTQQTTSSDEDGRFRAEDLARGLHNIWVNAPGYVEAEAEPTQRINRSGDSVNITMIKGGVITGTVTSANGEPVVAIKVRALLVSDPNQRAVVRRNFSPEMQTDDRGVYRIFGLPSGTYLVVARGNSAYNYQPSANEGEAPTYYPSSTRDTAAPVTVRAGTEVTGIDIRYRGERGHAISGTVQVSASSQFSVSLMLAATELLEGSSFTNAFSVNRGFAFYGVADGEYIVTATRYGNEGSSLAIGRVRVKVKGQDVMGLEIPVAPLGVIDGIAKLELLRDPSQKAKCEATRPALLEEVLIISRRDEKDDKEPLPRNSRLPKHTAPTSTGEFALANLEPGRYHIETQLPAETWYVRSLTLPAANATSPPIAAAHTGIAIKSGGHITVNLTLTEGAASLSGRVTPATTGARLPDHLRVFLVPAEKESADDALRFFEGAAQSDGAFAINHIAPGRYFVIARAIDDETYANPVRPVAWDEVERKRLRQEATAANIVIEPQSCQRVIDYALKFTPTAAIVRTTTKKP